MPGWRREHDALEKAVFGMQSSYDIQPRLCLQMRRKQHHLAEWIERAITSLGKRGLSKSLRLITSPVRQLDSEIIRASHGNAL